MVGGVSLTFDTRDVWEKMTYNNLLINMQTQVAGDAITEDMERHTFPYVPLKSGYLEGGFKRRVESYPPLLSITMKYEAFSNRGYDYAPIQEDRAKQIALYGRPFRHPRKGTSPYFSKGRGEVDVGGSYARFIRAALR